MLSLRRTKKATESLREGSKRYENIYIDIQKPFTRTSEKKFNSYACLSKGKYQIPSLFWIILGFSASKLLKCELHYDY